MSLVRLEKNYFKTIKCNGVNYLIPAILLLLPAYLIRFKIGGVPSTFLEIYIYLVFILFLVNVIAIRQSAEKQSINSMKDRHAPCLKALAMTRKLILPLVLFILAGISSYYARERLVALGEVKAYFFDGLLVFLMFYAYRKEELFQKWTLNFYLLSGLIVSFWGLLQRVKIVGLFGHQLQDPLLAGQISQGRILGPFESPNYLAMYIAPLIVVLVIIYFRSTPFSYLRKFIWPLVVIFSLTLILSQSLSSIIAVFLALALYFALQSKRKWWYLAFAVIILVTGIFFLNKYSSKSSSISARVEIYQSALRVGKDHQIIGIGPGNFPPYFSELPMKIRINYEALHPHNIFLAFWLYMGWPGLICFLAIIYLSLRKKNLNKNPVFYFLILTILLNGLTDTTFFKNDLSVIFWVTVVFLI